MDDVISLGVGEPDFDTPPEIVEAGVASLLRGRTHYTSNYGTIELRRALSAHLEGRYGVALRPGDGDPRHRRRLGGGRPRPAGDLRPGRRGDPPRAVVRGVRAGDHVRRRRRRSGSRPGSRTTSRSTRRRSRRRSRRGPRRCSWATRATPPVPSCPMRSRTSWRRIAVRHDLLVYSDEIYDRLAYGAYRHRAFSALPGMRERTILMGGFSKAYAMTGWRVGYSARRPGSSRGSSRSTSTGSCRRRRSPRTRRSWRSSTASRTSSGWSPSTTGAGGCSSTG